MVSPPEHLSVHTEAIAALAGTLREAAVDHPALSAPLRPCRLEHCRATCCHDGAQLSAGEAACLRSELAVHRHRFAAYGLPLQPSAAFAPGTTAASPAKTATRQARPEELAPDYPAHFPRTRCVFLDDQHRCAWQRLAVDLGQPPWFYKPITCWMHPLILTTSAPQDRPVLTLPHPLSDPQKQPTYPGFTSCTPCGRPHPQGQPAYDVLSEELQTLAAISGRDLLGELRARPSPWSNPPFSSPPIRDPLTP